MRKGDKFITFEDRKIIEKMLGQGYAIPQIATIVNKSRQTIYKELKRCPPNEYTAEEAQRDTLSRYF